MANAIAGNGRPQIHLLASESDLVADLALQTEHRQPLIAAMLLGEIERAELHDLDTLPDDAIRLGSDVSFVDEKTGQLRKVQLVLPAEANIAEDRISILTPMGAALYGLTTGDTIDWPDLDGNHRRIRIARVAQDQSGDRQKAMN
ncbi:MAG TPA: GreA/GreB family elongation factor [Sphingomicrobium sp.]|nr:GreA/GreB family elongation factor [Sphingomicrobium sp.]